MRCMEVQVSGHGNFQYGKNYNSLALRPHAVYMTVLENASILNKNRRKASALRNNFSSSLQPHPPKTAARSERITYITARTVYFLVAGAAGVCASSSSTSSTFLLALRASRRLRASLTRIRLASAWSCNILARATSAFFLWMYSIRVRLFLKTLPAERQLSQRHATSHSHHRALGGAPHPGSRKHFDMTIGETQARARISCTSRVINA